MEIDFPLEMFQTKLIEGISLSKYDISKDFIVFSVWESNIIFVYSFKTNIIFELFQLTDAKVFVTGLKILTTSEKTKYIFIATSDGKLIVMLYKDSKSIF